MHTQAIVLKHVCTCIHRLLFSSMCVHAYTSYCSQACVYMHTQAIVLKHVCTCIHRLLFSSMCVHAYTSYCSQACVYMHTQAIVLKHVCTCIHRLLFSSMCVHAYTSYCSQACVYMSVQLCISTKALKNSCISGNWDLSLMSLGQWWGLQELVSRCAGRLIYSELDHTSWYHSLCQPFRRKSACSWVHLHFHST